MLEVRMTLRTDTEKKFFGEFLVKAGKAAEAEKERIEEFQKQQLAAIQEKRSGLFADLPPVSPPFIPPAATPPPPSETVTRDPDQIFSAPPIYDGGMAVYRDDLSPPVPPRRDPPL